MSRLLLKHSTICMTHSKPQYPQNMILRSELPSSLDQVPWMTPAMLGRRCFEIEFRIVAINSSIPLHFATSPDALDDALSRSVDKVHAIGSTFESASESCTPFAISIDA